MTSVLRKGKKTLHYFKEIYRGWKQSHFKNYYFQDLLNGAPLYLDQHRVNFLELGKENQGKCIAFLSLPPLWNETAGFFALLNRMMCGLWYADAMGMIPVADNWTRSPYEEEGGYKGVKNVFEYYFCPLSDVTFDSMMNSNRVVKISNPNMDYILSKYQCEWFDLSESLIIDMGNLYKKYIKLNNETEEKIIPEIVKLIGGKKTLAIHYRGSDYKLGVLGHPVALTEEDYYPYIDEAFRKYNFQQIFLATDDEGALRKFRSRYKNIVYYKDIMRASGSVSIAFMERDNCVYPNYEKGLEVLRDVYTMANCDGLIAGRSQVSVSARINKLSSGKDYSYKQILSKGINRTGIDWVKNFKQYTKEK